MNGTLCGGVTLLLLLAGCAGAGPTAEQREAEQQAKQEALEDILSTPLGADEYGGEDERCLSTFAYRSVDVLDDQHVLFRGSGDRMWLNKLRHRCVGLRRDDTLRFDLRDNRICELDSFQGIDRFMYSARVSGNCTLGSFTPVTPEQMEAIEVAFKEAREAGR